MKNIFLQNRTNLFFISVFMLSILFFGACKVLLMPKYDEKLVEQIENVSKSIENLYLTMLTSTKEEDGGRAYAFFSEQYESIENELQSLFTKSKVKKYNDGAVRICEIAVGFFTKYKEKHKSDNSINDVNIELNLDYLKGILDRLLAVESAKNKY